MYMPVLELIILGQFMVFSQRPLTTRLLALLVCLLMWGGIIELELNLPESRDKIQWVAITLWSIETFPQVSEKILRPMVYDRVKAGLQYDALARQKGNAPVYTEID